MLSDKYKRTEIKVVHNLHLNRKSTKYYTKYLTSGLQGTLNY